MTSYDPSARKVEKPKTTCSRRIKNLERNAKCSWMLLDALSMFDVTCWHGGTQIMPTLCKHAEYKMSWTPTRSSFSAGERRQWSNDTTTNNGITPKSQELVRAGFKYPPVGVIVPSRFRWKYSLRNHQPVAVAYFWPRFEELQVSTWDSPWQSPKLSQSNSTIHGYSMDQYGTMMYNVHPCPLFQTVPIQGQRPRLGELSYRSKRRARGGMGAKTICGDSVWWSRVKSGTPKCIKIIRHIKVSINGGTPSPVIIHSILCLGFPWNKPSSYWGNPHFRNPPYKSPPSSTSKKWMSPLGTGRQGRVTVPMHTPSWKHCWLVVYLPLWKIWKSVGVIVPNIWKNNKC